MRVRTAFVALALVAVSAVTAVAPLVACAQTPAQGYPKRPIAYIVPYGAGSGNDVIARIVARKISDNWGQQIVVVNRPGATAASALNSPQTRSPTGTPW